MAPDAIGTVSKDHIKIFLAGSIEMGLADNWQDRVVESVPENCLFLNPRRASWNDSWVQSIKNPQFNQQVTWELAHLEIADIVFLYLDPKTNSPISLLELGLYAESGKLMVCCPEGFYRKGNVEIVCDRYKIPMTTSLEESIGGLKELVTMLTT